MFKTYFADKESEDKFNGLDTGEKFQIKRSVIFGSKGVLILSFLFHSKYSIINYMVLIELALLDIWSYVYGVITGSLTGGNLAFHTIELVVFLSLMTWFLYKLPRETKSIKNTWEYGLATTIWTGNATFLAVTNYRISYSPFIESTELRLKQEDYLREQDNPFITSNAVICADNDRNIKEGILSTVLILIDDLSTFTCKKYAIKNREDHRKRSAIDL